MAAPRRPPHCRPAPQGRHAYSAGSGLPVFVPHSVQEEAEQRYGQRDGKKSPHRHTDLTPGTSVCRLAIKITAERRQQGCDARRRYGKSACLRRALRGNHFVHRLGRLFRVGTTLACHLRLSHGEEERPTTPPCVPWPTSGSGLSFAVGRTAPPTVALTTETPSDATPAPWSHSSPASKSANNPAKRTVRHTQKNRWLIPSQESATTPGQGQPH